jgi:hypothetical protein
MPPDILLILTDDHARSHRGEHRYRYQDRYLAISGFSSHILAPRHNNAEAWRSEGGTGDE